MREGCECRVQRKRKKERNGELCISYEANQYFIFGGGVLCEKNKPTS